MFTFTFYISKVLGSSDQSAFKQSPVKPLCSLSLSISQRYWGRQAKVEGVQVVLSYKRQVYRTLRHYQGIHPFYDERSILYSVRLNLMRKCIYFVMINWLKTVTVVLVNLHSWKEQPESENKGEWKLNTSQEKPLQCNLIINIQQSTFNNQHSTINNQQ